MHRGEIFVSALVPAVIAVVVAAVLEIAVIAVRVELATVFVAAFVTLVPTVAVEFATPIARIAEDGVAELCGSAFPACGVFPTSFFAGFFRHDGGGALFALLLFAFAVLGVAFAFLAWEEFLAFGLGAAA